VSVHEFVPSDSASGLRFAIVAARWNEAIVRRLLDGALATLRAQGADERDIDVYWAPGSFELPLAAHMAYAGPGPSGRGRAGADLDAIIALGCVIRGETEHFRLVADAAAQGLLRVALEAGRPVANGVLAVEDAAQAESRSGGEHGNAGAQAALAAIHMANLHRRRWAT
jgi:6,7-dimethyl-8-ribityllumazine synthase